MFERIKGFLGVTRSADAVDHDRCWWSTGDQDVEVLFEVELAGPSWPGDTARGVVSVSEVKKIADLIWDRTDEQFQFAGLGWQLEPIGPVTLTGRRCIGLWVADPDQMDQVRPRVSCWLPSNFEGNDYSKPFWRD